MTGDAHNLTSSCGLTSGHEVSLFFFFLSFSFSLVCSLIILFPEWTQLRGNFLLRRTILYLDLLYLDFLMFSALTRRRGLWLLTFNGWSYCSSESDGHFKSHPRWDKKINIKFSKHFILIYLQRKALNAHLIFFCFFYFSFGHTTWPVVFPQPGIKLVLSQGNHNLNHWTTWEVHCHCFFFFFLLKIFLTFCSFSVAP